MLTPLARAPAWWGCGCCEPGGGRAAAMGRQQARRLARRPAFRPPCHVSRINHRHTQIRTSDRIS
eukprot:4309013-Prymnesium_polylepis.1